MRLLSFVVAATLLAAGCATPPPPGVALPSPIDTPTPSPAPVQSSPAPPPPVVAAPGGLLVAIRTARHDGFDRLVFEFGGEKPPEPHHEYVDAVTHDPSDRPVPLMGKAFVNISMQGAMLDTIAQEPDPSKAKRYTGPTRIAPDLPLIREVSVSGDFEAVLSFGVGLSRRADVRVQALASPPRVVFDFVY